MIFTVPNFMKQHYMEIFYTEFHFYWSRKMEATGIYIFMPPSMTVTAPIFTKFRPT
jgi:hypothetical protein